MSSISPLTSSSSLTGGSAATGAAGSSASSTGTTGSSSGTTSLAGLSQGVLSSLGVGSGMDVPSMVTALVQADTAAQQNQINAQTQTANTQLSSIGQLQAALSGVQAALAGLSDGSAFTSYAATATGASGGSASFTATAGLGAAPGTHTLVVNQLATAQSISSGAFSSSSAVLGSGTLVVGLGGKSFSINVDSGNDTVQGIADAINSASGNPGVAASVVNAADGAHLILTSSTTGAANTISVSSSGGDGGLSVLDYTQGGSGNGMTQQTAAQDASAVLDGFTITSASNSITNALQGVTINLTGAAPGSTQSLQIGLDTQGIASDLQGLVTAYNSYVNLAGSLSSFDSTTDTAGPLLGNATLNNIVSQLGNILSSAVGSSTSSIQSLGDIGLELNQDGTLSLDTNQLNSALTSNPSQVANLFNSTNGYGAQLDTTLNTFLQSGGVFDVQTQSINQQLSSLQQQQSDLNQQIADETTRYQQQFTAMDTIISQLQSSASAITQMMNGMNPTAILNSNGNSSGG
jgi:flagellar hook-associated protein 2